MTTLKELLGLTDAECQPLKYQDAARFRADLDAVLALEPAPAGGLVAELAARSGLTPEQAARAAALLLKTEGEKLLPKRRLAKSFYWVIPILFLWSAWYARPRTPEHVSRVVVAGQSIPAFAPIRPEQIALATGPGAGLRRLEDVVGRYATAAIPAGAVVANAALSSRPLPDLQALSVLSLNVSNLPAGITATLPIRITLTFSPKPQSSAAAQVFNDVWLLAEERNGPVSRVTLGAPKAAAEQMAALAAGGEATLVLPR